jgi:hydroxyacylglutathione hydrolase
MTNNYYKIEQINSHLYRILGITNEFSYLVIGQKKALLIDTCCGLIGIRQVVDSLTQLPYDVVLTHGHVDHIGGVGYFKDKNIFLNKNDFKSAKLQSKSMFIKAYIKGNFKLTHIDLPIPKKEDISKNQTVKYNELRENDTFDLGNLSITFLSLYGHTKGMMTALINEDKILILSDSCNPSTFLFLPGSLSLKDYLTSLEKYKIKVDGKFDRVILSHLPKECDKNEVDEMILMVKEILNGKKNEDTMKIGFYKVKIAKKINPKTGFNDEITKANLFYK